MSIRKRSVFNWSGGKDSALALWKAMSSGEYKIASLLTTILETDQRSSLHGIPRAILQEQADSIGLPLHVVELPQKRSGKEYENTMSGAVGHFKSQGVTHFLFGDICLRDIRSYREKHLVPQGITVVEPLWGKTTEEVMEEFLCSGFKTVIVTAAEKPGKKYIGKTIDKELIASFPEGLDICGENGEYHTLCYDGPLFSRPIGFSLGEAQCYSYDVWTEDGSLLTFPYWYAEIDQA